MIMQEIQFDVRGSRPGFWISLSIGVAASLICLYAGSQFPLEQILRTEFPIILFLAFFSLLLAIYSHSLRLHFENGYLIKKDIFRTRQVQLGNLTRARRYMQLNFGGVQPTGILELEDSNGNIMKIKPSEYSLSDIEELVELLHPYIFINRVDKNFMDLQFSTEQGLNLPALSIRKALSGSILYIILPSFVIALLIIAWAIVTNQPAFR